MTSLLCPYCHTPVADDEPVTSCEQCGAGHHADCWEQNGGCAVALCEGGPQLGSAAEPVLPTGVGDGAPAVGGRLVIETDAPLARRRSGGAGRTVGTPAPTRTRATRRSRARTGWVVFVIGLVVVGAAAALVLAGGESSSTQRNARATGAVDPVESAAERQQRAADQKRSDRKERRKARKAINDARAGTKWVRPNPVAQTPAPVVSTAGTGTAGGGTPSGGGGGTSPPITGSGGGGSGGTGGSSGGGGGGSGGGGSGPNAADAEIVLNE